MTAKFLRRSLAGLALLALLSACAPQPHDDPIQVTPLIRLDPKDLRMRASIPAGLGETGVAYFVWAIATQNSESPSFEELEMVRVGEPEIKPDGTSEVTYRLPPSQYKAFQTQQIRQRAQLLAGYYYFGVGVAPDLCRMAGTESKRDFVVSVLFDGRTGQTIASFPVDTPANALQPPEVGFCV